LKKPAGADEKSAEGTTETLTGPEVFLLNQPISVTFASTTAKPPRHENRPPALPGRHPCYPNKRPPWWTADDDISVSRFSALSPFLLPPIHHAFTLQLHSRPVPTTPAPSILTIGSFDGVHLGHRELLAQARRIKSAAIASSHQTPIPRIVTLVFDPSPRAVLRPGSQPPRLTTFTQRTKFLCEYGADEVIKLVPTSSLLSEEPEHFIANLCAQFHPIAFVEGADFRFGKSRRGDLALLRNLAGTHKFTVHEVNPIETAGLDQQIVTVSSTRIRSLLAAGRVADAAILLGRPYELSGTVVKGNQRGRTIGFPTANVQPEATDQCLPADGVYAAEVDLPNGRRFPAALNIGTRPTIGGTHRTIEPHIIDAPRHPSGGPEIEGLPEYGWPITIHFHAFLREQVKFSDLQSLREQLLRDVQRARQLLAAGVAVSNL